MQLKVPLASMEGADSHHVHHIDPQQTQSLATCNGRIDYGLRILKKRKKRRFRVVTFNSMLGILKLL